MNGNLINACNQNVRCNLIRERASFNYTSRNNNRGVYAPQVIIVKYFLLSFMVSDVTKRADMKQRYEGRRDKRGKYVEGV